MQASMSDDERARTQYNKVTSDGNTAPNGVKLRYNIVALSEELTWRVVEIITFVLLSSTIRTGCSLVSDNKLEHIKKSRHENCEKEMTMRTIF